MGKESPHRRKAHKHTTITPQAPVVADNEEFTEAEKADMVDSAPDHNPENVFTAYQLETDDMLEDWEKELIG
jgi:hypothetical protein